MIKRIHKDELARASFAIAGVLILMLGSVSAVYLAMVNNDFRNTQMENKDIRMLNSAIDKAHLEVQTQAYYYAQDAIYFKLPYITAINTKFKADFSTYIGLNFPKQVDFSELEVENYFANITLKEKNTNDYVRQNIVKPEVYNGTYIDELDLNHTEEYMITSRIPYYLVEGYVNYTIKERGTSKQLNKNLSINRIVKCAYPFLKDVFEDFEANFKGGSSDIGRMIKYILTSLAQYRVLMGDENTDGLTLITAKDVEQALNLAILLEEARRFRAVDPDGIKEFDARNGKGGPISVSIEKIITGNYGISSLIDPAQIFAYYNGFDPAYNDMHEIYRNDILNASKVANTQFQIGCNYSHPFEFFEERLLSIDGPYGMDHEALVIDQQPNYLIATKKASLGELDPNMISITDNDPTNDSWIYIGPPLGYNYSKLQTFPTQKSYETKWDISIIGKLNLEMRTEGRVFLRPGTHENTEYEDTLNIDIRIPVTVYSEWDLNNVVYVDDFGFNANEIEYIDSIWEAALPMIKWGIDFHQKVVEYKIEEDPMMESKINNAASIVRNALWWAKNQGLGKTIFENRSKIISGSVGPFSIYGFDLLIMITPAITLINVSQNGSSYSFSLIIDASTITIKGEVSIKYVKTTTRIQV